MSTVGDVEPTSGDLLDEPEAGGKAIRGGAYRLAAYGGGIVLSLGSTPLLIRHLGVVDFGAYVTVSSLLAIVALAADGGLTAVAMREYAARRDDARGRLLGGIVFLRIGLVLVGSALALAFALAAGYRDVMVAGTALGCLSLGLVLLQQTATIPMQVDLRFGVFSLLDFLRAALAAISAVVLVVLGAPLIWFFVLLVPSAFVVLAGTLAVEPHRGELHPRRIPADLRYLGREALPAAAATILNSLFYRVSIVAMSLIATDRAVGHYSAAYRVIEVLIVVPTLMTGTAFPIVARAAETDPERLRYALQRLFDMGLILGVLLALMVGLGAEVIIDVLAGPGFAPAVPALRIQGLALVASFVVSVWASTLFALRLRRRLVLANLFGLVAIIVLASIGATQGAVGTAIGATTAEWLFALVLLGSLVGARSDLRLSLAIVPRVLVAAAAGTACALLPVPPVISAPAGVLAFGLVLLLVRGVPEELMRAARERRAPRVD